MIVVMKNDATQEEIDKVKSVIEELGYKPHPIEGILRTVIGVIGDDNKQRQQNDQCLNTAVNRVLHVFV